MSAPRVSVLVVNYRSRAALAANLPLLYEGLPEAGWLELRLVNCSPDEELAGLPAPPGRAVVPIEPGANVGFARGVNLAAAAAVGEHLLLLNPDCRLTGAGLVRLAAFLDATPEAAAVAPLLVDPGGRLQPSRGAFPNLLQTAASLVRLKRWLPGDERMTGLAGRRLARRFGQWRPLEPVQAVDYATGACLLMRRRDFAAAGGLDERFFLFYEEIDLARRWRGRGRRVFVLGDLQAEHAVGGSSADRAAVYGDRIESLLAYYAKWEGPWTNRALRLILAPVLAGRYLAARAGRPTLGAGPAAGERRILARLLRAVAAGR